MNEIYTRARQEGHRAHRRGLRRAQPTPHTRFLRQLARVAAKHATRDSTEYTRCARSFWQYHGQRISQAIVKMTDALNIHEGTLKLKKLAL